MTFTARPAEPAQARAAVGAAMRSVIDATGARLGAARKSEQAELERAGALDWLADLTGIASHEVAQRIGVSRATVAKKRDEGRADPHQWPRELLVLLTLGTRGPATTRQLAHALASPPLYAYEIEQAVEMLAEQQLIAATELVPSTTDEPRTRWGLTPAALEDLPRRIYRATMPPSETWTVTIPTDHASAYAVASAGTRAFGRDGAHLIPAGTVHDMVLPEVVLSVEAPDAETAIVEARSIYIQLRKDAGLEPSPIPVAPSLLCLPPRIAPA